MAKKRQRKTTFKFPTAKIGTSFNCPECGRKKVVEVRFNKRENIGYLRCRSCGVEYNGKLKRATTPIDVYYEWIDHRDEEKENNCLDENNNKEENEEVEQGEEIEQGEENEVEEEQENEDQSQEKEEDVDDDDENDSYYN